MARGSGSREPAGVSFHGTTLIPACLSNGWWNVETRRYPVMIAAGVVWALAFPFPGIAGLAWLVPGLLLYGAAGLPGAAAFRCGYVAGLLHFLVSLRWLLQIPFPAGAAAAWLALAAYLACFPGLWTMLCVAMLRRADGHGAGTVDGSPPGGVARSDPEMGSPLAGRSAGRFSSAMVDESLPGSWRRELLQHAARPWRQRVLVPVAAAAMWVALEMIQARLFSGFPWNFLGVSQWRQVPLIQMAGVTGVYGVSFMVCWASVAIIGGCVLVALRPQNRWLPLAEARLPLFAVLVTLGTGFYRVVHARRAIAGGTPASIRLALVQPSIPQTLQWEEAQGERSFQVARQLSRQALRVHPDVLVWPEGNYGLSRTNYAQMTAQVARAGCEWLFSEIDGEDTGPTRQAYNAAFLMGGDGRIRNIYRKRRLVIFGEYIPLERWVPFFKWFTPIGSSFGSGARAVPMSLAGGRAVGSPVICFEDIFPHGIQDHAAPGVDFLIELTNDGWFGESGAQCQHAANAAFRAVENGIPLVRCTNNGLTSWFDAQGNLREVLAGAAGNVYGRGFLIVEIPTGRRGSTTFYQRHGDTFGWLCTLYAAASIFVRLQRGRGSRWELASPRS